MSPLPGTRVIHRRFSAHHRPVTESTMTAVCRITRPRAIGKAAPWTPQDGPSPAITDLVWLGPCRVQALDSRATAAEAAAQQVTTRDYLIAIPAAAPAVRAGVNGDSIRILVNPDDELVLGRVFRVVDIAHGSVLWQRDLMCADDLDANNPPDLTPQPPTGPLLPAVDLLPSPTLLPRT